MPPSAASSPCAGTLGFCGTSRAICHEPGTVRAGYSCHVGDETLQTLLLGVDVGQGQCGLKAKARHGSADLVGPGSGHPVAFCRATGSTPTHYHLFENALDERLANCASLAGSGSSLLLRGDSHCWRGQPSGDMSRGIRWVRRVPAPSTLLTEV